MIAPLSEAQVQRLEVWSGAQTGADQGGLEAALDLGYPIGGWVTSDFRTELGRNTIPTTLRPHLRATKSALYAVRTEYNVADTSATLLVVGPARGDTGAKLTLELCSKHGKPCLIVTLNELQATPSPHVVDQVRTWLRSWRAAGTQRLNVAGDRESVFPSIQRRTRALVYAALKEPL